MTSHTLGLDRASNSASSDITLRSALLSPIRNTLKALLSSLASDFSVSFEMDNYQRSLIAEFFSRSQHTSQAEYHQIVQQVLLPHLKSSSDTTVKVHPSPYQGSFSYTCVVDHHNPTSTGEHAVIQFRHENVDLWGNTQAHQLHGRIAPLVRFQGTYNVSTYTPLHLPQAYRTSDSSRLVRNQCLWITG